MHTQACTHKHAHTMREHTSMHTQCMHVYVNISNPNMKPLTLQQRLHSVRQQERLDRMQRGTSDMSEVSYDVLLDAGFKYLPFHHIYWNLFEDSHFENEHTQLFTLWPRSSQRKTVVRLGCKERCSPSSKTELVVQQM